MKNKEERLYNIVKEIEEVKLPPYVWRQEQIEVLKQTVARFVADYDLQNTFLFKFLKDEIDQL